jgi:hypothetical protein
LEALVCGVADQGFEAEAHGFGVGCGTSDGPRLGEELLVDVQGLLHTDEYAIPVHTGKPSTGAADPRSWRWQSAGWYRSRVRFSDHLHRAEALRGAPLHVERLTQEIERSAG